MLRKVKWSLSQLRLVKHLARMEPSNTQTGRFRNDPESCRDVV